MKKNNSNCKYMRSKQNWTPNDYELWFQHEEIPVNIPIEDVPNLSARIDQLTPLSKKVHIVLDTSGKEYSNTINIVSDLRITNSKGTKRVEIL